MDRGYRKVKSKKVRMCVEHHVSRALFCSFVARFKKKTTPFHKETKSGLEIAITATFRIDFFPTHSQMKSLQS